MDDAKKDVKQKKANKDKAQEKNIIVTKLQTFYVNIASEFKKIIWPKKDELAKQTVIVIVVCALFGAMIFGMDAAFGFILKLIAGTV